MNKHILPVTSKDVESRIVIVRGQHVLLDRDVAELYGVETKRINEAVKNNPEKFPPRCIIYLDEEESAVLRSKFSTIEPSQGKGHYSKYNFKAFTERGLYMLATILKSPRATQTTLAIIDTFVGAARDALSPLHLRRQHGGQRNREGASSTFPADPDRHPQPLPGRQLSGHLHHLLHHRRTRPQFLRRR